jgi:hypothetical protein
MPSKGNNEHALMMMAAPEVEDLKERLLML